ATKRSEFEKAEKERYEASKKENDRLVKEAQGRAAKAEAEAKSVSEQAEKTRTEAVEQADTIIADGKKRAQTLISEARSTAEATIEESQAESRRNIQAAQSQVDLLTKQRKTIAAQLDQLRSMFATPGLLPATEEPHAPSPERVAAGAVPTEKIADK